MVACTYPKLIAACHVLPHLSSRVILQPASSHQFAHIAYDNMSKTLTLYANICKAIIYFILFTT
jgi:hypothetical protein